MKIYHKLATGQINPATNKDGNPLRMFCYCMQRGPVVDVSYFTRQFANECDVNPGGYTSVVAPYPEFVTQSDYGSTGDADKDKDCQFAVAVDTCDQYDSIPEYMLNAPAIKKAITASMSGKKVIFHYMFCFLSTIKRQRAGFVGTAVVPNIDGIVDMDCGLPFVPVGEELGITPYDLSQTALCMVHPTLAAMSVLGKPSHQIGLADGRDPKHRIIRQSQKRVGVPKFGWRHHTIVVKPGKPKNASASYIDLNDEETMMPYHSVRAHYATYTKERPLFGKYAGRFYVPAHFRGGINNGVVSKDYKIIGACST